MRNLSLPGFALNMHINESARRAWGLFHSEAHETKINAKKKKKIIRDKPNKWLFILQSDSLTIILISKFNFLLLHSIIYLLTSRKLYSFLHHNQQNTNDQNLYLSFVYQFFPLLTELYRAPGTFLLAPSLRNPSIIDNCANRPRHNRAH